MTFSYLPQTPEDQKQMLAQVGVASMEDLFSDIPAEIRRKEPLNLPVAMSEWELLSHMKTISEKNAHAERYVCFLGGGSYDHFIPSVVKHLSGRSEFYTAYTPYQPEMSQGLLQAFYEYQSMMTELTALEVSNASLYDGASALAEAVLMAHGVTNKTHFLIAKSAHPEHRQVVKTYTQNLNFTFEEIPLKNGISDLAFVKDHVTDQTAAVIIQQPNFFGCVEDLTPEFSKQVTDKGAMLIVSVDPVSLGLLTPPGEYGASIAVGEGQGLGNAMSFGGPYLGFLTCKEQFIRRMPGRIIGQTLDTKGRRGFVLTLQTREQHIRREKATSNICTNQALMALKATIHLGALGKEGIREVAQLCVQKAHYAAREMESKTKFKLAFSSPFFKEFVVKSPVEAEKVQQELQRNHILGGMDLGQFYPELANHLLFCVTEKRTVDEIDVLVDVLRGLSV